MATTAVPAKTASAAASRAGPLEERRTRMPVVDVDDVDRPAVAAQRGERGPAEHGEPPRVVGVVVEGVAIEGRRHVDEAQPVAVGRDVDDRDGDGRAGARRGRGRRWSGAARSSRRRARRPTGSGAGRRRPARPAPLADSGSRPSARASASTTSARPPVLAHGSHSAASIATRMVIASILLAAGTGLLNRFTTRPVRPVYDGRRMEPLVHVPVAPGASFHLPPKLEGLRSLAYNMWWSWHPRARILFSRIDAGGWARYRNPIPVLSGPVDWSQLLDNPAFMAEYQDILAEFEAYMSNGADHWFQRRHAKELEGPIAYFCAEYGLHESLGIYSGGLGVLAGDHMKTASDMALPLIGVGLLYRKGYFRQTIDADGHQEHAYPDYEPARLPIRRALDPLGRTPDGQRPAAGPRAVRGGVGRPGRPRAGPAARHRRPRQRRLRPADHPHPVRARPRDAPPPGARPGRRRRAGAARSSSSTRRSGTSTRATRRSCSRSAPGSSSRAGRPSMTRSRACAATACSRSTRPSPRATSASTPTWSAGSPARCSTATAGRAPAACRSSACWASGWASRTTRRSST